MTLGDTSRPTGIGGRLERICGPGFARPAGGADEVAGRQARWVAMPGSPNAAADVLRLAAEHDLSVVPRGAGTKLDWGAPPVQVDVLLDTGRLAGIWHRSPGERTAEVGAGTPVRAVQAMLERSGYRLPVDVRSAGATVGGVVAADEAGPLRHRHGSPCSQVTEVSYVDAAGQLLRAGGVPASRAGELAPLLCGSQGALGVLISATVRVQEVPTHRLWVLRPVWTPLEVHNLVGEILASAVMPAAIEVDLPAAGPGPERPPVYPPERAGHPAGTGRAGRAVPPRRSGSLAVLVEGGPAEVAERARRLGRILGATARSMTEAPSWWRRYPFAGDDVALRIEVPIGDLHAAVYALRDAAGAPVAVRGSAGLGVVHAALPATTPPPRVAGLLTAVRDVLMARSGRCVVLAAPPEIRRAVDLWGDLPDLSLLRRIKDRYDPEHRLAPGRFPGGL
ncbi:FAD-binding oxidoreductase [Plantactinospora sp. KBS50]|uniref:FAD-binding oxidoreductase n=1 Tax=Plantactinospora sp. KBS50 TaxID=2024580 RepID=UPI000BAA9E86|nr:FAD-binding oxidoreductase [Plantactinospora sp. KBS50]ASW53172.1 FAD-linked oxidase [Plantactinospora sp. KBS50]